MSDQEDTLEHIMSGFNAYEAFNNQIPESSLSELNHILQQLLGQKQTQDVLAFQDKLRAHLYDTPDAHDLDIYQYSDTLLFQLYQHYRDSGYTGSVEDMLRAIEKSLEVGTHLDMVAGFDKNKAVNVVEWQWRFNVHKQDQYAHEELLNVFRPQYALNIKPVLSLDYRYNYDIDPTALDIPYWNNTEGTINLEICTNLTESVEADIIRLDDNDHQLRIHLSVGDRVLISYHIDDTVVGTTTLDEKLPSLTITRISLTYNANRYSFRDMFKTYLHDRTVSDFTPITLTSELKFAQQGNTLRSLSIYRQGTTVFEQNYFLN